MHNLFRNIKATRVENAAAAGTSDIESDSVDMAGFEGVAFVVALGAITSGAVTNVHLETSTDNSSFSDLEGSAQTVADDDDNQIWILDCYKPRERYIRCVVDRGTQNAVVDGITAYQYGPKLAPVTHDATTVGGAEYHASPARGTA